MNITIECSCGTPYEIEIDSPLTEPVLCPACGADATELVNQQFVSEDVLYCSRHSDHPAEEVCIACGKPICQLCMQLSGYVCSPLCRLRAENEGMDIPEYSGQAEVVAR